MKTICPRSSLILPVLLAAVGATAEVHAVAPSYTWNALIDSQPASKPATLSLRGIELSSDNTSVYASWIQTAGVNSGGTPYRRIVRYNAVTGFQLNSVTLPVATGTEGGEQAKSIATDDRGFVYIGSGDREYITSSNPARQIPFIQSFTTTLTPLSGKVTTSTTYTDIYNKRVGGLAVQKSGSTYYLYASRESGAGEFFLQRYDVTNAANPVLDTSFGSGAGFFNLALNPSFAGAGSPRGLDVGVDGTLYVTSDDPAAGASSGRIYRISPDLTTVVSSTVLGAFDVSLHGSELYVSRFENGNAAGVDVLNATDLAFVTGLTGTGTFNRTNADNDNGYSGIDVANDGRIFLADQVYNTAVTFDRLLVGTPTPEPASAVLLGIAGLGLVARRRRAARSA